jgi:hypothetical protein
MLGLVDQLDAIHATLKVREDRGVTAAANDTAVQAWKGEIVRLRDELTLVQSELAQATSEMDLVPSSSGSKSFSSQRGLTADTLGAMDERQLSMLLQKHEVASDRIADAKCKLAAQGGSKRSWPYNTMVSSPRSGPSTPRGGGSRGRVKTPLASLQKIQF